MKILVLESDQSSCLDWALRCQEEGHEVRFFVSPKQPKNALVGQGLVKRVEDWQMSMHWADLVFVGGNDVYLKEIDDWRKRDKKKAIIAPTPETAAWESDRLLGMKILRQHGIPTPPCREFTSVKDAVAYVRKENRPFVCKQCGTGGDKSLSYVAKTAADLIYMLTAWERAGKICSSFILQEKIEGVECGVGRWCGPNGFIDGYEENVEFKKLMAGDIGPNTGEMGSVLQFVKKSKLGRIVLDPLERALVKAGYIGCIDVNTIVDEKGVPWPLEFTMRPGWPAFNIQQAIMTGDHAQWLLDLFEGRNPRAFVYDKIALGVVNAIGDFPHSKMTKRDVSKVPVYGIDEVGENAHPCMMMVAEAPQEVQGHISIGPCWASAGDYVLVVTGAGETVSKAAKMAYANMDKISIPGGRLYRNDIGERLEKQLPELHKHHFLTGMEY